MSRKNTQTAPTANVERLQPAPGQGLSAETARQRLEAGACNRVPTGLTPSVGRIIAKNVLTLFNLINLLLAIAIILVGHPKNALFFGVAICNTAMGIFQELRAKRTLDKLSILAQSKAAVVRDGQTLELLPDEVVLDDILQLSQGRQICADSIVVESEGLEVDESLLTGESDPVRKAVGDTVLSGSFVVAGQGKARVDAVGSDNYAISLTVEAKREKKSRSQLMRTLNNIIRVLTFVIIPLGLLLFYMQFRSSGDLDESVLGATAAMIGMIPEGLILLTGVTLTVGALTLARRKALVQSLHSIETLARVDVLCLDKTGTITDGTLSFEALLPQNGTAEEDLRQAMAELMAALPDDNATAKSLRASFGPAAGQWQSTAMVPFSSARKWSGASFAEKGSYIVGAPAFVFPGGSIPFQDTITEYTAQGYRVLCLAHAAEALAEDAALPKGLSCAALLVLSDTIRAEAPETFRFFENEGVTLKVISGDDAVTVSTIAQKAGISNADKYIDLSGAGDDLDYAFLAEKYTVFGRVSPQQKRALIEGIEQNGHTACMTGDGVNDVPAMKAASCSVAMINGSDAARGACDFVLMTSDFSAMIEVLREGRRVINNIENVACLYLVKTIYSALLTLIYIFMPYQYPFAPLQMTPINALTVGIPSFFLALRGNYERPKGRFAVNILENSLPAALGVVFCIMVIQLAGIAFGLPWEETSTMNILLTGAICFVLLWHVSKPLTWRIKALFFALMAAFLCIFLIFGDFFMLQSLFTRNAFFYLPLLYVGPKLFLFLGRLVKRIENRLHPEEAAQS